MENTTKKTYTPNGVNYQFNFKLPKEEAPKVGKSVFAILLFFFTNFVFIIYAIIKFIRIETYTIYSVLFFALLLSLGIGFIAIAIFLIYKYILVTLIKAGYKYMTPFLKTISMVIAEKYAQDDHFQEKINKAFDFGNTLNGIYDKKTPWLIKKAIGFFINRLPFVEFIRNLSPGINSKDMRAVSESVYFQMDEYIVKKLFINNSMKWLFFLFPVNMIVQFILLAFIK